MLTAAGTDAYTLRVASTSNSCLQVHYGSTVDGMDVTSWYCDTTSLDRRCASSRTPPAAVRSSTSTAASASPSKDGSKIAGARLVQKTCSIHPAQRFDLTAHGPARRRLEARAITSGGAVRRHQRELRPARRGARRRDIRAEHRPARRRRLGRAHGHHDRTRRRVHRPRRPRRRTAACRSTTAQRPTAWTSPAGTATPPRWTAAGGVVENPAGGRSLINVNSGKCLAVKDGSKDAGADPRPDETCSIDPAQRWSLDSGRPLSTKTRLARGGFPYSGGGIRTRDLRVMSPTSYQTAPPRGVDQRV